MDTAVRLSILCQPTRKRKFAGAGERKSPSSRTAPLCSRNVASCTLAGRLNRRPAPRKFCLQFADLKDFIPISSMTSVTFHC